MGNLVIKNSELLKNYKCKSTHTGLPYLVVNTSGYLDLTTKSTVGTYLVIESNGSST